MTLKEQLKELQGYVVKVGAAVNFVYCGKCDENVFDEITKVSDWEIDHLNELIDLLNEHLNNFDKCWSGIQKERLKRYKNAHKRVTKKMILELIEKTEEDKKKDLKNSVKRYGELCKQAAKFTPFLTREVTNVYDSTSKYEPNTKIIIINGEEKGRFWNVAEYQAGVTYEN